MKQCHEHGSIPVNTFAAILKRYVVRNPAYSCSWTGVAKTCSATHSCLMAERSSTNLILQAAMLAVGATTHLYVLI
jgi:hypothetical protein